MDDPGYGEDKEAFDRINFLLDVAETRIRDTILCGWSQLHGQKRDYDGPLLPCLNNLTNGYYIEIIAILAKFFENKGLEEIQGVDRKKALISFFLENNGRLSDMLTSALRPFSLIVEPTPVLSYLLNIEDLVNFYNSILSLEMNSYVDMVMNQVKSNSKADAADAGFEYSFYLPWYPTSDRGGLFETRIPEDTCGALTNYLRSSVIAGVEGNVGCFVVLLKRLEDKVLVSVATAYIYLAKQFLHAIGNVDFTKHIDDRNSTSRSKGKGDEELNDQAEEIDEHVPYLCSVANDSQRLVDNKLITNHTKGLSESGRAKARKDHNVKEIIKSAYSRFRTVSSIALESLSCVLFRGVAARPLLAPDFASQWFEQDEMMISLKKNGAGIFNVMMEDYEGT